MLVQKEIYLGKNNRNKLIDLTHTYVFVNDSLVEIMNLLIL